MDFPLPALRALCVGKAKSGRHHCYPPGFVVRKSRRSTMLPAFYEQGYDPIMMESQFPRN